MREAGRLRDAGQARRFSDYLLASGVENRLDQEEDEWIVWVLDDDQLDLGKRELERFLSEPDHERYAASHAEAEAIRKREEEEARRARKQNVDLRRRWQRGSLGGKPQATMALIIISVGLTLLTQFGTKFPAHYLYIDLGGSGVLSRVLAGQVWRLVTPIFMHGGWLHIIFNMYWLWYLGAMVELRRGTARFLGLVLLFAVGSNLVQYFWGGWRFLGMSGVVYGLLGYAFMKGRWSSHQGMAIHETTWLIMVAWLALGFLGFMNMANGAHLGGLVLGLIMGGAHKEVRHQLRKLR